MNDLDSPITLRYRADELKWRLQSISEDESYARDGWSEAVLSQAAAMLERLQNVVTTDHESKEAFVARVRSILNAES